MVAKATRRRFTLEYKRKIVREADGCKTPGAVGALLRREGLYSSHLATWRAARDRGELAGLARKRGPHPRTLPQRAPSTASAPPGSLDQSPETESTEIVPGWQSRPELC